MPQRELRCPGEDSNLHAHRAQALNLLRMPIPPPGLWSNYSLFITLVNLTNRLIKNLTEKESSTHGKSYQGAFVDSWENMTQKGEAHASNG